MNVNRFMAQSSACAGQGDLGGILRWLKSLVSTTAMVGGLAAGLGLPASAQVQEAWSRVFNGGRVDGVMAMGLDAQRNVYVTGYSLTNNSPDSVTIKYSPDGSQLWLRRYGGAASGNGTPRLAVNSAGESWVAGSSEDTNGVTAYVTIKYDSNGETLWVRRLENLGYRVRGPIGVVVDGAGNSYVAGSRIGNGDEYLLVKYAPDGTELWVRYLGSGQDAVSSAVALDGDGHVVLTGGVSGPRDAYDILTVKFDGAGNLLWTVRYDGEGNNEYQWAADVFVDPSGNIYTTGGRSTGFDGGQALTLKYSPAGVLLWASSYSARAGEVESVGDTVKVDSNGNVYVTGSSIYVSGNNWAYDLCTIKYDANGTQLWAARYPWQNIGQYLWYGVLQLDGSGNAYVGASDSSVTLKYASDGNLRWFASTPSGFGRALAVDDAGNVFRAGQLNNATPPAPFDYSDFLVAKYTQTDVPSQPRAFVTPSELEAVGGSNVLFSAVVSGPGPFTYQWRFNGQRLPGQTNSTLTLSGLQHTDVGDYSVIVSNATSYTISPEARLTAVHLPPSIVSGPQTNEVRLGKALTLSLSWSGDPVLSFQWQHQNTNITGATNFLLFFDGVTEEDAGSYTLTISNAYGIAISAPITVVIGLPGPLDYWYWRYPLPQGNDLYSAAYGNGRYVVVGRRGAMLTSEDGTNWLNHNEERFGDLLKVIFADGKFVAVGSSGGIFLSSDGLDWQSRGPGGSAPLVAVAFGNGTWVVSEWYGNGFYTSTDGSNWTRRTWDLNASATIVFGAGRFVVASSLTQLRTSTNGVDWTPVSLPSTAYTLTGLAYGNGRFVLAGNYYCATSTDGLHWVEGTLTGFGGELAAGPGVFVGLSNGGGGFWYNHLQARQVVTSTTGLSWTEHTPTGISYLLGLAYVGNRFLAVGDNGNLLSSPDGVVWTPLSDGTGTNLRGIAHGNGRSLAVGNSGRVFSSLDGEHWAKQPPPTTDNLRGLTYGNGLFAAAAESGAVLFSSDGSSWRSTSASSTGLYGITSGKGLFIAVGDGGALVTSLDGTNWTAQSSGTPNRLHGITCGNNLFVASGTLGAIVTSPNGTNWTARNSGTDRYLEAVAYGNGRYVAAGEDGTIVTSSDAVTWTARSTSTTEDLEHITFGAGVFVAVGGDGTVVSSTDGGSWQDHYSGSHNNLRNIVYADGAFTIAGNNDTILQSAQLIPLLRMTVTRPESCELRVRSVPNRRQWLQASGDLGNWGDLLTFKNNQETTTYLDTEAGAHRQRLYRVRLEP